MIDLLIDFFLFVISGIIANVPLTVFCMLHIQQKVHNFQRSFHNKSIDVTDL